MASERKPIREVLDGRGRPGRGGFRDGPVWADWGDATLIPTRSYTAEEATAWQHAYDPDGAPPGTYHLDSQNASVPEPEAEQPLS
jgi:hypothetical protein